MSNTILILTSETGRGHLSLAEALRERLVGTYAVETNDPQPRIVHWHYRTVARHALWLWAAEFRLSNTKTRALVSHRLFAPLVAPSISALLDRLNPHLILTTYPFLSYEVTRALRCRDVKVPFVMLLADPFALHASWFTACDVSATLAPTCETYAQTRAVRYLRERVHYVGWPVREQFYRVQVAQPWTSLGSIGLSRDRFTVFLQGGGDGAAGFSRILAVLLAVPKIQVILATGTNRVLAAHYAKRGIPGLRVLPFTREIAPYMAMADVVMGKAGPNTLFEALTLGKPFIATSYIPGQEEGNLEFIRRHQLGWVATKRLELLDLVSELAGNPEELDMMRSRLKALGERNRQQTGAILPVIDGLLGGCTHPICVG